MQKIATRIFIVASLVFGVLGIVMVLMMSEDGSDPPEWLMKAFLTSVFVILPSFALSVAGRYLDGKK